MYIIRNQTGSHGNLTVDGTIESYRNYLCNGTATPSAENKDKVEFGAFLYIVVVVVLYAVSITCLLIRYARNYEEEKDFKYHYTEFVNRERFQALTYRNKLALERTKKHLENIQTGTGSISRSHSDSDLKPKDQSSKESNTQWCQNRTLGLPCPVITITNSFEMSQFCHLDRAIRVDYDSGSHSNTVCERLCDNPVRVNGINSNSCKYGNTSCEELRTDLLMVPVSGHYQPYDMTLSCDSGVDYLDNHVVDVPEDGWNDDRDIDYGRDRNCLFVKGKYSPELQSVKIIVGEDTCQEDCSK